MEGCLIGNGVSPLSIWWQVPNSALGALSECFCNVTAYELAYARAPKNMRALVMSLFLFTNALSSAVGEAITPALVDPHLIWYVVSNLCTRPLQEHVHPSHIILNAGVSLSLTCLNRVWAGPAIALFVLTIHFYFTYRHLDNDEFMSEQNEIVNFQAHESPVGEESNDDGTNGDEDLSEKVPQ